MNAASRIIDLDDKTRFERQQWEGREDHEEGSKRGSERRLSLPVLVDPAEDLETPLSPSEGRECVSLGNSPRQRDDVSLLERGSGSDGGGKERRSLPRRPGLVRHESLPSLHLNARCLNCDRVGIVYCKGCEAHYCAKHDRIRHRFVLWKKRHQPQPLPGISYFRLPLPGDIVSGGDSDSALSNNSGGDSGSALSNNSDSIPEEFSETRSSTSSTSAKVNGGGTWAVPRQNRLQRERGGRVGSVDSVDKGKRSNGGPNAGRDQAGSMKRGARAGHDRESNAPQSFAEGHHRRRRRSSGADLARRGWYDKIVMAIVRPPRCKYTQEDMGPTVVPLHSGLAMKRKDFEVRNRRGLKLVCSQWRPAFAEDTSQLPCVVYLHGNSSARVDVIKTRSLTVLSAALCTVVSFDFSGSGMSEGDWVTLGYFEQHDVADVLAYLRSNNMASRYLLWGRSMGAASALLYAACYPSSNLCGLILDSPFSSFRRLARDLVTGGQIHVPGFLVNGALALLRRSVKNRTRCDLKTVAPITFARRVRCPCLFIAARKDLMVRPHHGAELSDAVGGASLFVTCRGSHNTSRPSIVLQAIGTFVKGCFRAPDVPISETLTAVQNSLADAQEAAKARRIAGRNVTTGGGGGSGGNDASVIGSIRGSQATAVGANGERTGPGSAAPRPLPAPGPRGSVKGGGTMTQEVPRPFSYDGRTPRATSLESATDLGKAVNTMANRLRPPHLVRSKSQNAGDGDLDCLRKPSARSSTSSARDSVVEIGDMESDCIAAEEYDADVVGKSNGIVSDYGPTSADGASVASVAAGRGGSRNSGRGIRAVFPNRSLQEMERDPPTRPRPRRHLGERSSDLDRSPLRGGEDKLPYILEASVAPSTVELTPRPHLPVSSKGFDAKKEASGRSAANFVGDEDGKREECREKKGNEQETTETAARKGKAEAKNGITSGEGQTAGKGAVAVAAARRDPAMAMKLVVFDGMSDSSRSRHSRRRSAGSDGRDGHTSFELGSESMGATVGLDAGEAKLGSGDNGEPRPTRRASMAERTGGGSSGGWLTRVRLKPSTIGVLGPRRARKEKPGDGKRPSKGQDELVRRCSSVRSKRNSSSRVCKTCANSAAECLCEPAGTGSTYVPRTTSGKLKM